MHKLTEYSYAIKPLHVIAKAHPKSTQSRPTGLVEKFLVDLSPLTQKASSVLVGCEVSQIITSVGCDQ